MLSVEQIKSARLYHKSQKWDDSPIDEAIDVLLAENERLQAIEKAVLKYLKADENSVEAAYYELCALCGIEPKD